MVPDRVMPADQLARSALDRTGLGTAAAGERAAVNDPAVSAGTIVILVVVGPPATGEGLGVALAAARALGPGEYA
jgi:hypothetical protein